MQRRSAWWRVAVLATPILTMAVASAPSAPVSAAPPGAPRVTLMGDSTLMAMEYYANDDELLAQTYDVNLQTGNCRRLVVPSCPVGGRPATPSALPLMQTTQQGKLGQVLVMMTGYDDSPSLADDIDAIMTEATAQGVGEVLWLTYRESPTYFLPNDAQGAPIYIDHNQRLREATSRWPNLSVLDWHAYSIGHPEWFSADGIHLRPNGTPELAKFIKAALDERPLSRCDARNALTGTPDQLGTPDVVTAPAAGFTAIEPVRVLDTRDPALGGANGMLGAGRTVAVPVGSELPAGATAAVVSVGAVNPCAMGYLTVFPCDELPYTSNVNFAAGRNTASMVVSMLGDDGDVCVHSPVATDLIVDLLGAFVPGGEPFHPIEPTRWIDTRGGATVVDSPSGRLTTGTSVDVAVRGRGPVAPSATAAMVNVTVAGATADTAISLRPGPCAGTPTTSVLNVSAGRDGAASAIVGLGPDGSVCATAFNGGGHLILDVAGWFGPGAGGLAFAASTPARLLDTRDAGAAPQVAAGQAATAAVDAPSMLSVALVQTAAAGWASVTPCGASSTSSLLNTVPGEPIANATAVAPGTGGDLCLTPSTPAHFVVDRTGTFVPAG